MKTITGKSTAAGKLKTIAVKQSLSSQFQCGIITAPWTIKSYHSEGKSSAPALLPCNPVAHIVLLLIAIFITHQLATGKGNAICPATIDAAETHATDAAFVLNNEVHCMANTFIILPLQLLYCDCRANWWCDSAFFNQSFNQWGRHRCRLISVLPPLSLKYHFTTSLTI